MIDSHCCCQRKHLPAHQGLSALQIARELTLEPRTVASWLTQEHFRPRTPRQRSSTRAPFQPEIGRLLDREPYAAAQVFQRLRENGVDGGYSRGKASVRAVRPRRQPALLTLAFAPGACAQVDWGMFGSVPVAQMQRRLRFCVMVLGYSRMMSVEGTVSQPMEHFLACHQPACAFFGGLPPNVMVANRKSAVLSRALGEAPVCNPTYRDCATHCGFPMAPCNVGKGHEKGRGENALGDVKKNVLAGLESPDFGARNPAARQWLDPVAKARVPGDTRDKPTTLWHKERPSLRPLPLHPFDPAPVSQVRAARQCRRPLDTNRSAVPAHYAGQALTRNTSPARLCLYPGDMRIARHPSRYERCQEVEAPDPPTPLLAHRKKARAHQIFLRFLALSPRAAAYDLQREARRLHPPHHGRTIVALSDLSTPESVARALEDACTYEAFSSEYIATLVEPRVRVTPAASALPLTRREDLWEMRLEPPDRSLYHATPQTTPHDTSEADPMSDSTNTPPTTMPSGDVEPHLTDLQRAFMAQHDAEWATHAAQKMWPPVDSLARRVEGEAALRRARAPKSRLRLARFPVITT
jgi:transposase